MKFPYRRVSVYSSEAFPKRDYILRPIIPINLISKDNRLRFEALIDSGADYTVFPAVLGRLLEIEVESGKKDSIVGVSGESINVYFHNIVIEAGGWPFEIFAGFADEMTKTQAVLGQSGFFDLFVVKFDLVKKEIELKPRK